MSTDPSARQRCTLPANRRKSHTDSSYLPPVVGNREAAFVNGLLDSLRVQVGQCGQYGPTPTWSAILGYLLDGLCVQFGRSRRWHFYPPMSATLSIPDVDPNTVREHARDTGVQHLPPPVLPRRDEFDDRARSKRRQ